jgi:hypothetical protein
MTREERLQLLKQIEKDIHVCSLESTLTDDMKSCAIRSAIEELEKEACEDAISREAAKEAVETTIAKYIPVFIGRYERIPLEVAMTIKNLPPVKPTNKEWIPVSERLPEVFEFVNCTCHSLIDNRDDWVVETVYVPQPEGSPYSDWGNIPMLNWGQCEVVAWMRREIPEPYKKDKESKK